MTALPVAFSTSALACYDERGLDLPPGLPFDRWQAVGEALCHMERNIGWWLGDWWRYGERTYGEAAALAAPTGYALGTVKNAAWVANRFPESSRRRDDLTFKHHQEVAPLEPRRADALLAKAAGEGLSARDLRYEVQRLRHDERMGLVRAEVLPTCRASKVLDPACGPTVAVRGRRAHPSGRKPLPDDGARRHLRDEGAGRGQCGALSVGSVAEVARGHVRSRCWTSSIGRAWFG